MSKERNLSLDGVLSKRKLGGLLKRLHGFLVSLLLGQSLSDGSRLLDSQVQRLVGLSFVGLLESSSLAVAHHSQDSGDGQTHDLNLGQLVWGASGNLGDAKKSKLILQVSQLVLELLLALALKFANLQFCCTAIREVRWKKEEKWSIHKYIHIFFGGKTARNDESRLSKVSVDQRESKNFEEKKGRSETPTLFSSLSLSLSSFPFP